MASNEVSYEWNFRRVLNAEGNFALLVLNLDQAFADDGEPLFERLWTNAKERLLVDGGANCVYQRRQRFADPTVVCGDFDSIRPEVLHFYRQQKQTQVVEMPDQMDTDFTKSANYAIERFAVRSKRVDFLVAVWQTGGRIDHCLSCINTLYKNRSGLPIYLLDMHSSLSWLLPTGQHRIANNPSSQWCSLVPVGRPCLLTTSGFRWNLHEERLQFGGLISTSNEFDPQIESSSVSTDAPILFSMHTPDEKTAHCSRSN